MAPSAHRDCPLGSHLLSSPSLIYSPTSLFAMSLSQVDSDTESESDTSVVDATFTAFRPPAPSLAHNVTDEVPTLAEDMLSAIAFLNDLDCERLENVCAVLVFRSRVSSKLINHQDLERIHQASASLLDGMDAAISSPGLCLASEEFCHAFCVLSECSSFSWGNDVNVS